MSTRSRSYIGILCLFSLLLLLAQSSSAFAPTISTTNTKPASTRLALATDANNGGDTPHQATSSPIIIAMTREEGKNEKLRKQLTQQLLADNDNDNNNNPTAVDIVELPCIAHADGPDYDQLAERLTSQPWDYVTVTSPEAARVLASAWNALSTTTEAPLPAVAAVGKATEATLQRAGIPVAFCPSKATAKVLVQELPDLSPSSQEADPAAATTVLYPASARAPTTLQDGLAARGFAVTRLNTYDTVTATWTSEQLATAQQTTIVCVASPSSIQGWLSNLGSTGGGQQQDVVSSLLAACIGETSAQACRELGFEESQIFFPDKPGIEGWAKSVQEALDSLAETTSHSNSSFMTA